MFKTPTNEDSDQSPSRPKPHECNTHHHDLEYRGADKDLGAAHHTLRSHHPVPVPVLVSNHSDSTLQGKIAGKQAKGSTEVGRGNEKLSHEEQEQCGTRGGLGDEDEEFPEGGIKAWSVVLGSFLALFSALGIVNSIGIFQAYLSQNDLKDCSASKLSWMFGTHPFLALFCGVQIGPIFDKRGPRELVLTGSVGIISMFFLMSICKEFWQYFLVFGVLGGTSVSLLFTPAVASVGHWFRKRRANATGLAITGGSFGGIVFPMMFKQIIPMIGFPWACRVAGFIQIVLLIPANFLVRSRLKPLPDAKVTIDFTALREPIFTLTTFATFITQWGIFVPITYLASYAIHIGAGVDFSYELMAIFNAGSVFGRWLPSYFADFVGRFNMIIFMSICSFTMIIGLWLPSGEDGGSSKAMLIAAAVACGFCSGSSIGLVPVCVAQISRLEDYGKRYGTCYCLASFACLTGVPIAGSILSIYGSYNGLIWFAAASFIASAVLFMVARVIAVGWSLKTVF